MLVVDLEAQQVSIVYKITPFRDMDSTLLQEFQFNFDYIRRDQKCHSEIKCNHAQTRGQMKYIGYRTSTEKGFDFGTYAMHKALPSEQLLYFFSNRIQFH